MSEIRWQQRFVNFQKAYSLLQEVVQQNIDGLNPLEQEGAIQRFEFTFELAWKVLKDFLEFGGIELTTITPRQIIKEAFAAKLISDGQVWLDMLDLRNLLSHTYDHKVFTEALIHVQQDYWPHIHQFHEDFIGKKA